MVCHFRCVCSSILTKSYSTWTVNWPPILSMFKRYVKQHSPHHVIYNSYFKKHMITLCLLFWWSYFRCFCYTYKYIRCSWNVNVFILHIFHVQCPNPLYSSNWGRRCAWQPPTPHLWMNITRTGYFSYHILQPNLQKMVLNRERSWRNVRDHNWTGLECMPVKLIWFIILGVCSYPEILPFKKKAAEI